MDARLQKRFEIETVHELLGELSYYQLLGLDPDAPQTDIEPAFRAESRKMHPDRMARLGDKEISRKANEIYRAINEGYRVLREPEGRSTYDEELEGGRTRLSDGGRKDAKANAAAGVDPVHAARTEKGGKYWRMALQDWNKENFNGAVLNIQFAMTYEPGNDVFAEYMAKAKAAAETAKEDKEDNPYMLKFEF